MQVEKLKNSKFRFKILKVSRYKGCPIYTRTFKAGEAVIFEYMLVIKDEIYSHYFEATRDIDKHGKLKALSKKDITECTGLIYEMACVTIDTVLGEGVSENELSEEDRVVLKKFQDGELSGVITNE